MNAIPDESWRRTPGTGGDRSGRRGHDPGPRGFTLIELLVVVAIISLLMSLLAPSLRKARDQARTVACMTNLRTIGMGFHVYASEYYGQIPYDENLTSWSPNSNNYELPDTSGKLFPHYVPAPMVVDRDHLKGPKLTCPSYTLAADSFPDHRRRSPFEGLGPGGGVMPTNVNYAGAGNGHLFRTYRQNDFLLVMPADWQGNRSGVEKRLTRLNQVRSSSLIFALESHTKSFASAWGAMYYNPRHDDKGMAVHLDNSVTAYPINELTLAPSGHMPGNPNYVNRSDVVDAWGNYLDPNYTKGY